MPDDSIERHFKTEGTVAINFAGLRRGHFVLRDHEAELQQGFRQVIHFRLRRHDSGQAPSWCELPTRIGNYLKMA